MGYVRYCPGPSFEGVMVFTAVIIAALLIGGMFLSIQYDIGTEDDE